MQHHVFDEQFFRQYIKPKDNEAPLQLELPLTEADENAYMGINEETEEPDEDNSGSSSSAAQFGTNCYECDLGDCLF
jgi:hypothetical protein